LLRDEGEALGVVIAVGAIDDATTVEARIDERPALVARSRHRGGRRRTGAGERNGEKRSRHAVSDRPSSATLASHRRRAARSSRAGRLGLRRLRRYQYSPVLWPASSEVATWIVVRAPCSGVIMKGLPTS